ncbi:CLUMA_CG005513, isoform A [Clunio marinus]|uniref:CLUMA_CG005513, isoform A n=1 Tax=Clunio marinus TaxID=568069 RepID=A0A1J1HV48_9DIPT|nr:CLUMA_CG005513, isoform A [Clunio marinus]
MIVHNIPLLLTLAFVSTASASLQCVSGCWRNNVFYPIGAEVPSLDSCNTCWCTDSGIACTEIYCPPETPEPTGCTQNGINYQDGDEVPSLDSCNTCWCTGSGIACTEIACLPEAPE